MTLFLYRYSFYFHLRQVVRLLQLNELSFKARRVSLSKGHQTKLASIYHHLDEDMIAPRKNITLFFIVVGVAAELP